MVKSSYEPLLNQRLGELLEAEGLSVVVEEKQPGSTRQIDIAVNIGGIVVAVEGESSRRGAIADAQKRLDEASSGEVIVHEAIGAYYPTGLRAEQFNESTEFE